MNEQLQKALVDIITKATTGMDTAISFLSEELPDVIHQLLMWHMVESLVYFSSGVILAVIIFIANYKQVKYVVKMSKENSGYIDDAFWLVLNMFQLLWIIPIVILFNLRWLQILIAPKLYLIEYAASLIK